MTTSGYSPDEPRIGLIKTIALAAAVAVLVAVQWVIDRIPERNPVDRYTRTPTAYRSDFPRSLPRR